MANLNRLGLQTGSQETFEEWKTRINGVDSEGLHVSAPQTIRTWTGRHVDPQNMRPSDIDIRDVAHALARICRYGGHTFGHLSVARHSLWVADRLHQWYPGNTELELWGLLHDAGEAYLGDMVRPMKHSPAMAAFRAADDALDVVIAHKFALSWPRPTQVGHADAWVLNNQEQGEFGARFTWIGNGAQDEVEFLAHYIKLTGGTL